MTSTSSGKLRVRRLFVFLTVAALALLGLSLNTAQAFAADRPGTIKSVVVNPDESGNPSGKPINLYDGIVIAATWEAPAGTKPGDTFEMALPPQITGTAAAFAIEDKTTGDAVGDCVVEATKITCTFNDFVNTHNNVKGNLGFYARALKTSTESEWSWDVGNKGPIITSQPGGVGPYVPDVPKDSSKGGWMLSNGNIRWAVVLVGKDLVGAAGGDVSLKDTYDNQLTLLPASFTVQRATAAQVAADEWETLSQGTAAGQYTATFDPAGSSFETTIHGADAALIYRIAYSTVPPKGTPNGSTFRNTVTADGKEFLTTTARFQSGFGDGGGDVRTGSVSWTKNGDGVVAPLAGSEWSLVGPNSTVVVVDNGAADANPTEGVLEVTGLAWGQYVLTETKAPSGYVLDPTAHEFVVAGNALKVDLGTILNAPIETEPTSTTASPTSEAPAPPAATPPAPETTTEPAATTPAATSTTPTSAPLANTGTPASALPLGIGAGAMLLLGVGLTTLLAQKRRQH